MASPCSGDGFCIHQCCCTCYEDEVYDYDISSEVCTCGHRNHTHLIDGTQESAIFCQIQCPFNCVLQECHNFRLCGQKRPQYLLNSHNGMCLDCAVMIGKIKFLDITDDCPVCMETKGMIEINCRNHKLCLDCWKHMSDLGISPLKCPLCRESIWKR